MSRKLIDRARTRLQAENGGIRHAWGGRLSVALIFPNRYSQAMSNLGFLTVHHLLNSRDDTLCERFFLPDPEELSEYRKSGYTLFSLESGRPLHDFDLIAVSLSFENDALNLPLIFELGRVPLLAAERGDRYPLVLCGGVCAFLNPEPYADFFDIFAVGEAEALLDPLIGTLMANDTAERTELLARLATLPGIYVPSLYTVTYNADQTIARIQAHPPARPKVRRQWCRDLDHSESRTFITTPESEFSGMALTEISRGCSRGCRFCAAGFIYRPPREKSLDKLLQQIECGLVQYRRQGLVGAAVSDYTRLPELTAAIEAAGGEISPASMRIDAINSGTAGSLANAGHRTATLAPEAGSQRLRDLINKGIDEDQILAAARHLGAAGILNLKLYFLIGLPNETADDIEAILDLAEKIREIWREEGKKRGRLGRITLSVNPFVPKPFTPLQWAGMEDEKVLEERIKRLRQGIARLSNLELIAESPKAARLQAFLSRGDRRCSSAIIVLSTGKNLWGACRESGLDPTFYTNRERGISEILPWEIIDNGMTHLSLRSEYERAKHSQLTPPCAYGCSRCGICVRAPT